MYHGTWHARTNLNKMQPVQVKMMQIANTRPPRIPITMNSTKSLLLSCEDSVASSVGNTCMENTKRACMVYIEMGTLI